MRPRQKLNYVDDPVSVGRRLRAAREQAGLSQRALSFPGCTAAYISRIEHGERIPSLQLMREFASRLGVGEHFLAFGREDAPESKGTSTEVRLAIRMGDLDEARALADTQLTEARSPIERASAFGLIGQVALAEGDLGVALAAFEQAVALDRQIEERDPHVAESLGRLYGCLAEQEAAVTVFRRNLDRAVAAGDPIIELRFARLLASALIEVGKVGEVEQVLTSAVATSETFNDPLRMAGMYWARSRLYKHRHEAASASDYVDRSQALFEASDRLFQAGRVYQLLARLELERGNGERALVWLERATTGIAASGRTLEFASLRVDHARALLMTNRHDEAAGVAQDAASLPASESGVDAGRNFALLADVFAALDDAVRAIEFYELAVEQLDETPNRYSVEVYARLASLYERRGDQAAMVETLKRGLKAKNQAERLVAG